MQTWYCWYLQKWVWVTITLRLTHTKFSTSQGSKYMDTANN